MQYANVIKYTLTDIPFTSQILTRTSFVLPPSKQLQCCNIQQSARHRLKGRRVKSNCACPHSRNGDWPSKSPRTGQTMADLGHCRKYSPNTYDHRYLSTAKSNLASSPLSIGCVDRTVRAPQKVAYYL